MLHLCLCRKYVGDPPRLRRPLLKANGLDCRYAYVSEICRKEHRALGMSVISISWGVGLGIGPAFGGFLAQPADKYLEIISEKSIFGRFPYFLPCLLISGVALVAFILYFWLLEIIHSHNKENIAQDPRQIYRGMQAL